MNYSTTEIDSEYFNIVTEHLDISKYVFYTNGNDNSIQMRAKCPFCGNDTLSINMTSGLSTCWSESCSFKGKGGYFYKLYAAVKNISYDRAKIEVNRLTPNRFSNIKTSFEKLEETPWDFDLDFDVPVDVFNNTFEAYTRINKELPDYNKYYNWIVHNRKPSYPHQWFFDRFEVYEVGLYPYSARGVFKITTRESVGFLAYALDKITRPKTLNPGGAVLSNMLFNYNETTSDEWLFVVEGLFTCARAIRASEVYGRSYDSIATFGTNLSLTQARLIAELPHKNIVFLYDYGSSKKAKINANRFYNSLPPDTDKNVFWRETPFFKRVEEDGIVKKVGLDLDDIGTKHTDSFLIRCINGELKKC